MGQIFPKKQGLIPKVVEFTTYTPTFAGFGTPTNQKIYYRLTGSSMDIIASFSAGTTTATTSSISLPSGYTFDYTILGGGSRALLGYGQLSNGSVANINASGSTFGYFADGSSTTLIFVTTQTGGSNSFNKVNTSAIIGTGETMSFNLSNIPVITPN